MKLHRVLQLGHPLLYEISQPVRQEELTELQPVFRDLHDIILEFRAKYNAGRAIAAPQIGVMKRIICWNVTEPKVLINPQLVDKSEELFELWDDCMSFPNLLVKLRRHKSCTVNFLDEHWQPQTWHLQDDLSELIQHEYDHLDGILATQRAIDERSFRWR
ncbi:MAG: peptide deformylase [Bacteroidota bacterium]